MLAAVRRIPPGRVATYGDIAALAGSPRAWRAVGTIMRENRDPGTPCHRVIAAGGALGKKFRVITYDDKSDAREAATAVTRLVTNDHVTAVLLSNPSREKR